jgi:hypothetical protein
MQDFAGEHSSPLQNASINHNAEHRMQGMQGRTVFARDFRNTAASKRETGVIFYQSA